MRRFPPFENLYEHELRRKVPAGMIADRLERAFKYLWAPLARLRIDICLEDGVGMSLRSETRCCEGRHPREIGFSLIL